MLEAKRAAFAPGTLKNYRTQWSKFIDFTVSYNMESFPTSPHKLSLYAIFLSQTFKSSEAIRNYLSGVKKLYCHLGLDTSWFDDIEFKQVLKGIGKLKRHKPSRAFPVSTDILKQFYCIMDISRPLDAVFWGLFLVSFFSMARKSNLVKTEGSDEPDHVLRRHDISFVQDAVLLHLRSSKTDQDGSKSHIIPLIEVKDSILCPVKALKHMLKLVPALPEDNLFVYSYRGMIVPVTYRKFHLVFRKCLELVGISPEGFSSHSFRRGGAIAAFRASVPSELIKHHGGWTSDAYLLYLEFSLQDKLLVSRALSTCV